MLPLKDAISEKHSQAEKMPFNQRMFRGELTKEEYVLYLAQQFTIFGTIEGKHTLPHPALGRAPKVLTDIRELLEADGDVEINPLESTLQYVNYLNELSSEDILAHIYLNYMALMFGGQMMKKNIHGSGKMYEFDGDMRELIGSIRAIQKDEWADEANKALDFNMSILEELENVSNTYKDGLEN